MIGVARKHGGPPPHVHNWLGEARNSSAKVGEISGQRDDKGTVHAYVSSEREGHHSRRVGWRARRSADVATVNIGFLGQNCPIWAKQEGGAHADSLAG